MRPVDKTQFKILSDWNDEPDAFREHPHIGIPFKGLGKWVLYDNYCAFRSLSRTKLSDVTARMAFIEKTARVRTDFINNAWKEGPRDSEDYGFSTESLAWCDYMLYKSGFELDVNANIMPRESVEPNKYIYSLRIDDGVTLCDPISGYYQIDCVMVHGSEYPELNNISDIFTLKDLFYAGVAPKSKLQLMVIHQFIHDNFVQGNNFTEKSAYYKFYHDFKELFGIGLTSYFGCVDEDYKDVKGLPTWKVCNDEW